MTVKFLIQLMLHISYINYFIKSNYNIFCVKYQHIMEQQAHIKARLTLSGLV